MVTVQFSSNTHSFFKIFLGHNGNTPTRHRKTLPVFPRAITDLDMRWDTHPLINNGLLDSGMTAHDHVFHNDGFLDRYSMLSHGHQSLSLPFSHSYRQSILHFTWSPGTIFVLTRPLSTISIG